MVGPGFRGLASLGPFLGAPAGSSGEVKYTGGTGSGAWHPLTPSWVPSVVSFTTVVEDVEVVQLVLLLGTDRGMPVPQIMLGVEVASFGVLPLVQFLDKVADMPVASMTGALGDQCRNCGVRSCSADAGVDVPVVQVVVGFLGAVCEFR